MYSTIDERREHARNHDGEYNTMARLQAVLRKDFSPESLQTDEQKHNCARLLIQKAKDYEAQVGDDNNYDHYYILAYRAIERFLKNWRNKEPGESEIGKTSLGHIANAVAYGQ